MWNYDTRSNICVIGVLEGEEKEGKAKKSTQRNKVPKPPKFVKRHALTDSRS